MFDDKDMYTMRQSDAHDEPRCAKYYHFDVHAQSEYEKGKTRSTDDAAEELTIEQPPRHDNIYRADAFITVEPPLTFFASLTVRQHFHALMTHYTSRSDRRLCYRRYCW